MSDYTRFYQGKLYLYYLKLEDSGEYECYLPDGRTSIVKLEVKGEESEKISQINWGKACFFNISKLFSAVIFKLF